MRGKEILSMRSNLRHYVASTSAKVSWAERERLESRRRLCVAGIVCGHSITLVLLTLLAFGQWQIKTLDIREGK